MVLMEPGCEYAEGEGLCALTTWTDWDLEICLNNECSRKQIRKSRIFSQWIDIRGMYKVSVCSAVVTILRQSVLNLEMQHDAKYLI